MASIRKTPDTLSPIETIALSKAVKDTEAKKCRGKLAVGHHDVDFSVRVSGPLLVAPSTPVKVQENVPADVLLALVMESLKPRDRQAVLEQVDESLAGWRGGDELPEVDILSAEYLLGLGQRERAGTKNGNVTAPLTVELVSRHACPA